MAEGRVDVLHPTGVDAIPRTNSASVCVTGHTGVVRPDMARVSKR